MKPLLILALFLLKGLTMNAQTIRLLVGQYNKDTTGRGIYTLDFDTKTQRFGEAKLIQGADDPSFVAISSDNQSLAWSNESDKKKEGKPTTGMYWGNWHPAANAKLSKLQAVTSTGEEGANCFVAFSPDKQWLASAFYVGGKAVLVNLKTGRYQEFKFSGNGPNPKRQEASHVHQTFFASNGDLWICDLGTDKVHRLQAPDYDAASMQTFNMPAGMGPRHVTVTQNGEWVYVLGELDGHVVALQKTGDSYVQRQRINAMSDESAEAAGAEILLNPEGEFLYTSHRGKLNNIFILKRDAEGRLSRLKAVDSGGRNPRHFTISRDGQWLFCAHQSSNNIVAFRRDVSTGGLTKQAETSHHKPVCLVEIP